MFVNVLDTENVSLSAHSMRDGVGETGVVERLPDGDGNVATDPIEEGVGPEVDADPPDELHHGDEAQEPAVPAPKSVQLN